MSPSLDYLCAPLVLAKINSFSLWIADQALAKQQATKGKGAVAIVQPPGLLLCPSPSCAHTLLLPPRLNFFCWDSGDCCFSIWLPFSLVD